jgi:hypothetical protein
LGRRGAVLAAYVLLAACGTPDRVSDPIDGVPHTRQQTISRSRLGFRWPLSAGTGTLACDEHGVILFRAGGVTYVVKGQGPAAADISPLRLPEPSPPPSNPVKRLTQEVRMNAFAALERCHSEPDVNSCARDVRTRFGLSDEEARLIDAEGRERRWPPLTRGMMPLDPLVNAGRALCGNK